MTTQPDFPDPSPFIDRLENEDAFFREAAASSLGNIGSPLAARPLAGLLLRELRTVERSGYLDHGEVVRAVAIAIRRIGATEALYAVVKALCVLTHAKGADEETVEELAETLAEVGGPNAVREACDRITQCARSCQPACPGLEVVSAMLLERLSLCGDAAVATLRRLASSGPAVLRPYAVRALRGVTVNPAPPG